MTDLGEEGLREIIRRKPEHTDALIGYALNCITRESYEEARVFLESALALKPNSVLINCIIVITI